MRGASVESSNGVRLLAVLAARGVFPRAGLRRSRRGKAAASGQAAELVAVARRKKAKRPVPAMRWRKGIAPAEVLLCMRPRGQGRALGKPRKGSSAARQRGAPRARAQEHAAGHVRRIDVDPRRLG